MKHLKIHPLHTLVLICTDRAVKDDKTMRGIWHEVTAFLEDGCRQIVLDLAEVETVSSLCPPRFIAFDRKLKDSRSRLVLCRLRPEVTKTFEQSQAKQILTIVRDIPEALRILAPKNNTPVPVDPPAPTPTKANDEFDQILD